MIYRLDESGRFSYINEVGARFIGMDASDIIGMSFYELIREDHVSRVRDFYMEMIRECTSSKYLEFPVRTISGRRAWVGQTAEIIYDSGVLKEVITVARDVTEKVHARHLAKNNEEKYRNIIENIHLGLLEVDLSDTITYANSSFCDISGYELDELLGKKANQLLLNEGDELSEDAINSANEERTRGTSSAYEIKIRRKDGTPVWLIVSGAPVVDSFGEVIGSIGIHHDISERKQQEQQLIDLVSEVEDRNLKLTQKQEFLASINRFAAGLINSNTIESIVSSITQNVIGAFGFEDCVIYLLDQSEQRLRQVSAFGPKESNGAILNPIEIEIGKGIVGSVAQTGVAEIVEDTRLDERYIQDMEVALSELAVPIISEGKVIGVIDSEHPEVGFYTREHMETLMTIAGLAAGKIRNAIISQKNEEAEKALKESEAKLRSVINSALDAVITINAKGEVTEWNPQAAELFGYSRKEAKGNTLSELIIPENYRRMHEMGMAHFRKTGEGPVLNKRIEIQGLNKAGEVFPIELSIVPLKMGGEYFFSAFVRDITVRKRAEEDMQTALEKEKELSHMKSRFVSMASHEFRTPLTTIQANLELLDFRLKSEELKNRPPLMRSLSRMESEVKRLNTIMNDILMMGKMDAGSVSFKPEPQDMMELCGDVVESFNQLREKQVRIDISGEAYEVEVDHNLYEHIITNLISNAVKYSPEDSEVVLNLAFDADEFRLSVTDKGIGIEEDDLARLFESFFRSEKTAHIQGTGLGLAIVKQFVDLHEATIDVESKPGAGSTFTVRHKRNSKSEDMAFENRKTA